MDGGDGDGDTFRWGSDTFRWGSDTMRWNTNG